MPATAQRAAVVRQEYRLTPLSELAEHPRNPNQGDVGAIYESIESNGFYGAAVAWTRREKLFGVEPPEGKAWILAGAHRVRSADHHGISELPIIWIDVDEKAARRILLVDNRARDRAGYDKLELARLLEEQVRDDTLGGTGFDGDDLDQYIKELGDETLRIDLGDDSASDDDFTPPEPTGIYAFREDATFPSSNKWGIPDLRDDMLSSQVVTTTYAGQKTFTAAESLFIYSWQLPKPRESARGGVLGFFTEDYRFEVVWNEAVSIVERFKTFGWGSVIAPDFSEWRDDPLAVRVFNIYRSRWCARYWQEAGIPVIPTMYGYFPEEERGWKNAGIPKGAPMVAVQCRTSSRSEAKQRSFLRAFALGVEEVEPGAVLLYGGAEHKEWLTGNLPEGPVYHFISSRTAVRDKHVRMRPRKATK